MKLLIPALAAVVAIASPARADNIIRDAGALVFGEKGYSVVAVPAADEIPVPEDEATDVLRDLTEPVDGRAVIRGPAEIGEVAPILAPSAIAVTDEERETIKKAVEEHRSTQQKRRAERKSALEESLKERRQRRSNGNGNNGNSGNGNNGQGRGNQ